MRIVDLTQPIRDGMAVYPGDPAIEIAAAATIGRDGYAVYRLALNDQAGTHVETQAHMIPGRTLDQEPLGRFVGSAAVVDVPRAEIRRAPRGARSPRSSRRLRAPEVRLCERRPRSA